MPKPTLHEIVKINAQYILLKCVDVYYYVLDCVMDVVLFCTIFYVSPYATFSFYTDSISKFI